MEAYIAKDGGIRMQFEYSRTKNHPFYRPHMNVAIDSRNSEICGRFEIF